MVTTVRQKSTVCLYATRTADLIGARFALVGEVLPDLGTATPVLDVVEVGVPRALGAVAVVRSIVLVSVSCVVHLSLSDGP